jgi:hypothetical protein
VGKDFPIVGIQERVLGARELGNLVDETASTGGDKMGVAHGICIGLELPMNLLGVETFGPIHKFLPARPRGS